ncbi:MAG: 3-deoxy-D-manno-octulosonic acid transferase [Bacteroidetes bacterium HGW-Bacteroidetes-4]|jgi:3-deoxy-D-manno-octulosonic-acid transferase|nr:MAG: 3-deoxy-D-manno-octulosonic acid transferase [Bacteroidetes bacterium HGW-Bacteroidetes-4]
MRFLYSLGIWFYVGAIYVASLFNQKAKQWVKGRQNWYKNLQAALDKDAQTAWFHVSSLGEFEQGRPVIEGFRKRYPEIKIVLTFFSPSGYEIRKDYPGVDYVCYLPVDTRRNAKKFVSLVNPSYAFFVKYDFWFHFLKQLHLQQIPTYIFSAIFRPQQLFFKRYGAWYRNMLRFFTRIYVQNDSSKDLLESIGITQVEVGGDTRFDRVYDLAIAAKPIDLITQFASGKPLIIAGSTWEKDEEFLAAFAEKNKGKYQWIIAPHEVHEGHIQKIEALFKQDVLRFSNATTDNITQADVLLIDSIGILSSLYRYGTLAYIGGGFGKGIHNILEAATYGLPVVFGPNYLRFQEACDLIERKSAFTIQNYIAFETILQQLLKDADFCKKAGENASQYVNEMRGGTQKILSKL